MKYIGLVICLLIALFQVAPIYNIVSALLQEQVVNSTAYYMGKLSGHIFLVIILLLYSFRLLKKIRNS